MKFLVFSIAFLVANISCQDVYQIGTGIADITGPAADIGMMGYAKPGQDTAGIHFRLYSRAFIIADQSSRVCIVNTDLAMISQIVKLEVVQILKEKYNGLYHEGNVLISATHTHSGPGGYLQYVLYIISTQGFIRQSFQAAVHGIVMSIERAHLMASSTKGSIFFNEGELLGASINRSPTAYLQNPEEERSRYQFDTDKGMQILKLVDSEGNPLGLISWFAVHCTSMNNTNRLISGDNKGYASYLFEQYMDPSAIPGKGRFVAAFVNSNEGDVSPNTRGPHCTDTGLPCDVNTSTCSAMNIDRQGSSQAASRNEKCVSAGPGRDMFESTKIIGQRQFEKAKKLFESAELRVKGSIGFIHQYINMTSVVLHTNKGMVTTCKPAMGYSFAAGTTDGPGAFDFSQGTTRATPFWNLVRDFLKRPSEALKTCQHPKPILFATGDMKFPYAWQPSILPTQVLKVGNILVAALPAEFTTMAGRRIRDAINNEATKVNNSVGFKVMLSGLANAYSSYVVTPEEYNAQRYEAASTIFGPHTLAAYIQQYMMLAHHVAKGSSLSDEGPQPQNLLSKQISLKPGVVYDGIPYGKRFGDIVYNVQNQYRVGDQVFCSFIAGNPRNDLQTEKTFLTVERREEQNWVVVATDANWETKFFWHRTNTLFGESQATILWDIPGNTKPGIYRIRHFGAAKSLLQQIKPYIGSSNEFQVTE